MDDDSESCGLGQQLTSVAFGAKPAPRKAVDSAYPQKGAPKTYPVKLFPVVANLIPCHNQQTFCFKCFVVWKIFVNKCLCFL